MSDNDANFLYRACKRQASKFSSLKEWEKKSRSSYVKALKNKWQKQIAKELGWNVRKDAGHWDNYENCVAEASKYSSLSEWRKKSPSSYLASKDKWHGAISQELAWVSKVHNSWSYEDCKSEASKFSSLKEWEKNSRSSYFAAVKNNVQRKIAQELNWKVRKKAGHWNSYENCKAEASQYSSLKEWEKNSTASYFSACKNKWQRQIAHDLDWANDRDNDKPFLYRACKRQAAQFSSLNDWITNGSASYKTAVTNKWQREIAQELGWEVRKNAAHWDIYENCLSEASQYSSFAEWMKKSRRSYFACKKWHESIRQDLGWKSKVSSSWTSWTYDTCKAEASKFSSLQEWVKNSTSYRAAYKKNWQRKIAEELGWKSKKKRKPKYSDDQPLGIQRRAKTSL